MYPEYEYIILIEHVTYIKEYKCKYELEVQFFCLLFFVVVVVGGRVENVIARDETGKKNHAV